VLLKVWFLPKRRITTAFVRCRAMKHTTMMDDAAVKERRGAKKKEMAQDESHVSRGGAKAKESSSGSPQTSSRCMFHSERYKKAMTNDPHNIFQFSKFFVILN
jgi:hypothetical protein